MRNCSGNSCCDCACPYGCEIINGNNIDIDLKKNDCEVRADVVVARNNTVRIWGQIRDCEGVPVPNALVKLVKPVKCQGKVEYQGVAHITTDCNGFYQFEVCPAPCDSCYKILVSKSTHCQDRVICPSGNCTPCCYNPCNPPEPKAPCCPKPCCPKPCCPNPCDCKNYTNDKPFIYYYSE